MSKNLEKLKQVESLPIFPLPLVLMPNELVPLHIFEDRYQKMLADVASAGDMFGIVYFEPVESFIDRPVVGSIGCLAEVRDRDTMADGRSNIVVLGTTRFQLSEYADTDEPYLVAEVEFFEDAEEDPSIVDPLADEVFAVFERIAKAAFAMSGNRSRFPEITRTDPESFSFLTASAFSFDNDYKAGLIEMTSTVERLEKLHTVMKKAVRQMEETAGIQKAAQTNGHSKKKLDI